MKAQPFRMNSCPFMLKPFCLALIALLALAGCARRASNESGVGQSEITVAAAANLSDAFVELGQEFTRRSGVRVVYSFGATADLAKQIENGAPFDLFAAADVEHLDALARAGLLAEGTQTLYARGRLVLWIPPGSRLNLARLEDLSGASVERVAIAKPDVAPYGRAATEALRALDIWSSIEPKVIYSQNVSQARQYAATGNADAAFIPRSLVRAGDGRTIDVPATLHQPINQSVAVIKASQKQQAAHQFIDFLLSPEGQSLLERYGYEKTVTSEK
jgi:molybdate transport system substrate-binding protein